MDDYKDLINLLSGDFGHEYIDEARCAIIQLIKDRDALMATIKNGEIDDKWR